MNQAFGTRVLVRFDPRRNSVNAIRLVLALLVLASHTLTMSGGTDPLGDFTGSNVDIGTVAVDGFFALSGFLITRSYLRSPSVWRYVWRRCLRILPAFWVCLLVSAVVILPLAQLFEFGSMQGFPLTGEQSVLGYVINNAGLYMQQFQVRGLMQDRAVDGSLYTLIYEFVCYLGIALVGVLGLLRRRWVVLGIAAVLWLSTVADAFTGGGFTGGSITAELFQRLGMMFLAGAMVYLWADRIPLNWVGGATAAGLLILGLIGASYQDGDPTSRLTYLAVAPAAVAYLVILVGANPRFHRIGSRRDLSYGVYVYAWPVQVLLLLVGAAKWPVLLYFAAAVAVTGLLAFASWTLVESPALALKSWTPPWSSTGFTSHRRRTPPVDLGSEPASSTAVRPIQLADERLTAPARLDGDHQR